MKRLNQKYKMLNNVKTIASYDPISNQIILDEIESTSIDQIFRTTSNGFKHFDEYLTVHHELRHFIDMNSSVFGNRFRSNYYKTIEIVDNGMMNVDELWNIKKHHDNIATFGVEKYFHNILVKNIRDGNNEKWTVNLTIGSRFNSRGIIDHSNPIFLANYTYEGKYVARIPISTMSLFETNAVATEIYINAQKISNSEDKEVENELFKRDLKNRIYCSDILEYSVIPQITSTILKDSNITSNYFYSEQLSKLSINMPRKLYEKIRVPDEIKETKFSIERIKGFINNIDPTFIFICLLYNIKSMKEQGKDFLDINSVLEYSYLPSLNDIVALAREEIVELNDINYETDIFTSREERIKLAVSHFDLCNPALKIDKIISNINKFEGISIIFSDEMLDPENAKIKLMDFHWDIDYQTKEFISACR